MADIKPSDVLSQSEVEAILASLGGDAPSADQPDQPAKGTPGKPGAALATVTPQNVQPYDVRAPVFLSPAEVRRLRIKHEEFAAALAVTLSVMLRGDLTLRLARIETIPFKGVIEMMPTTSYLTLFKLAPLDGIVLMDIAPRLGLSLVDRMMGGPGHMPKEDREFTDIEKAVLRELINLLTKEYAETWMRYIRLEPEVIEFENTPRFLSIVAPCDIMLFIEMEARFADCLGSLRYIIPYKSLDPLTAKLMAEMADEKHEETKAPPTQIPPALYHIPVPVSVVWRGFTINLGDLRGLGVGDVLLLDPDYCQEAVVQLGGIEKFRAKVDRSKPHVNAQIVAKLEA